MTVTVVTIVFGVIVLVNALIITLLMIKYRRETRQISKVT